MTPDMMKQRTFQYALRVVKVAKAIASDAVGRHISGQLIRAGTSVASNYRASCRARSRAEFVAKMGTVEEEGDETLFWLEFIIASGLLPAARLAGLIKEGNEIVSIVVKSKQTARSRTGDEKSARRIAQSTIDNRKSSIE